MAESLWVGQGGEHMVSENAKHDAKNRQKEIVENHPDVENRPDVGNIKKIE
jgi:hypothetical protein